MRKRTHRHEINPCSLPIAIILLALASYASAVCSSEDYRCTNCGQGGATVCDWGWKNDPNGVDVPIFDTYTAACTTYEEGDTATGPCGGNIHGFTQTECGSSGGQCCFHNPNGDNIVTINGRRSRPSGADVLHSCVINNFEPL